ncbi:MAG: hypothetical protein FJ083_17005 [Cyanobacteria bacterium K_Offshore_surface_m2_239]|nr:hypothetical protein [Cyanobacteria bacterium K_Offshore_surface_m2_239]
MKGLNVIALDARCAFACHRRRKNANDSQAGHLIGPGVGHVKGLDAGAPARLWLQTAKNVYVPDGLLDHRRDLAGLFRRGRRDQHFFIERVTSQPPQGVSTAADEALCNTPETANDGRIGSILLVFSYLALPKSRIVA